MLLESCAGYCCWVLKEGHGRARNFGRALMHGAVAPAAGGCCRGGHNKKQHQMRTQACFHVLYLHPLPWCASWLQMGNHLMRTKRGSVLQNTSVSKGNPRGRPASALTSTTSPDSSRTVTSRIETSSGRSETRAALEA